MNDIRFIIRRVLYIDFIFTIDGHSIGCGYYIPSLCGTGDICRNRYRIDFSSIQYITGRGIRLLQVQRNTLPVCFRQHGGKSCIICADGKHRFVRAVVYRERCCRTGCVTVQFEHSTVQRIIIFVQFVQGHLIMYVFLGRLLISVCCSQFDRTSLGSNHRCTGCIAYFISVRYDNFFNVVIVGFTVFIIFLKVRNRCCPVLCRI